jgi:hypothetical protein
MPPDNAAVLIACQRCGAIHTRDFKHLDERV